MIPPPPPCGGQGDPGTTLDPGVDGDFAVLDEAEEEAEVGVVIRRRRRAGDGVAERIPALLAEK